MLEQIIIKITKRTEFIDITRKIQEVIAERNYQQGLCTVYVHHTTAGLFINEAADPAVCKDLENFLDRLVPWKAEWEHLEGNAAAHVKAVLCGNSHSIPIQEGKLQLGTWQGIFLAEFDGPRTRKVLLAFT